MNHKLLHISKSPDETFKIGCELAKKIIKPVLVGLIGELGTGKTTFAKGFAFGLDVKELLTSPTFLGISEYYSGSSPFIHMDFYKKVQTKENIGSYLNNSSVIVIEWAQNFELLFGNKLKTDVDVYIEYEKDKQGLFLENQRVITIKHWSLEKREERREKREERREKREVRSEKCRPTELGEPRPFGAGAES